MWCAYTSDAQTDQDSYQHRSHYMCIYARGVVFGRVVQASLLCVVSLSVCAGSPHILLVSDRASRTPIDVATPTY